MVTAFLDHLVYPGYYMCFPIFNRKTHIFQYFLPHYYIEATDNYETQLLYKKQGQNLKLLYTLKKNPESDLIQFSDNPQNLRFVIYS